MKILVVDDDYVSRVKLKELLASWGSCDMAGSGESAVEMFKAAHESNNPYELITVDIAMQGIQGQECVRLMRQWEEEQHIEVSRRVKIVMVTIKKDMKSVASSYYEGVEGYITKPVTPESMNTTLTGIGLMKR